MTASNGSSPSAFPGPLALNRRDDVRRVRDVLRQVGYDDRGLTRRMDADSPEAVMTMTEPLFDWRTRDLDPLGLLIRLFMQDRIVPLDAFARAAAPVPVETWRNLGLIEVSGERVRRVVQIFPFEKRWFLSDRAVPLGSPVPDDYVMGIGAATKLLASQVVPRRSRRTLDLGTGGGFQAFAAAGFSDCTIATDINDRALNLAVFGAQLNDLDDRVEFRKGSFFEPVADERFDLIVSNPPFVITPQSKLIFVEGGAELRATGRPDVISSHLIEHTGNYLNEGGFGQFLVNWAIVAGENPHERLESWCTNNGCDVWILEDEIVPADRYAVTWLAPGWQGSLEAYQGEFVRWMDYFRARRIEAVGFGLVNLRKRSGSGGHFRIDAAPKDRVAHCGHDIARQFELFDFLEAQPDEAALLEGRFRLSPHVRLVQECKPSPAGFELVKPVLMRNRGLCYRGDLDGTTVAILMQCDGRRTLEEVAVAIGAELGIDGDNLRGAIVGLASQLLQKGFLWPAEAPNYEIHNRIFEPM